MTETAINSKTEEARPVLKKIAGVHFSRASKVEYFLAEDIPLKTHDLVVIKGEHKNFIGRVTVPPRDIPASDVATNIKPILRKAVKEDIDQHNEDMEKAREAFELCNRKISEKNLPMKLVDVSFEDNKGIFFFFAEERVDFRSLVKDLASTLHMRIEMRQIGARDEAKAIGALGPCGIVCCCETYLSEFTPISITMAKNQGLSPNPAKLTGMCGKLKCCLSYENPTYLEERKSLPPLGAKVKSPAGTGTITNLDILRHTCTVRIENGEEREDFKCKCSECSVLSRPKAAEKRDEESDKEYEKLEG